MTEDQGSLYHNLDENIDGLDLTIEQKELIKSTILELATLTRSKFELFEYNGIDPAILGSQLLSSFIGAILYQHDVESVLQYLESFVPPMLQMYMKEYQALDDMKDLASQINDIFKEAGEDNGTE